MFFVAVVYLPDTFDTEFFFRLEFAKNVGIISAASIGPICFIALVAKPLGRFAVHYKNRG